ncbi:MAG: lysine--tRNA ligase [Candidatus Peregrinibacteria bacterium]|nr:lysine--tRNA ligase [Candidatus Peregrinibacteria bacterium]
MAFWVDDIAEQINKAYPDKEHLIIRDEKTASGRVHVGSLRGVVIHGVIAEALNQMGRKATFYYEINDVDPMDGLPVYLDKEAYAPHMGKPLRFVPPPDENGRPVGEATPTDNFARTYGNEFVDVIKKLGFTEENNTKIVWASEFYEQGFYNEWIEKVCAHPNEIRQLYKEASGSVKDEDWFPLQMVCEKCGKVGSTKVIGFDGKEAEYICQPDQVDWAKGCGYHGKAAPWDGVGKVPWKVEWAVKWAGFNGKGVDIEGSGKDHNAAGGSHDVSAAICEKILDAPMPFNIPYEFFLFGGAKMSASKGLGATAKGVSEMMPPELLRFLMVRTRYNQTIEFNIDGDTIPRLYDNHDECAEIYFDQNADTNLDLGRAYYYAQLDPIDGKPLQKRFLPRFSQVAFMAQIPHLDVMEEVKKLKGAELNEIDREEAQERSDYAKVWLEDFADDRDKFEIQDEIPELAHYLNKDQKQFLKDVALLLSEKDGIEGEALHGKIHEIRKASPLQARDAFGAIYAALLGKKSGPQAGWFLEALEHNFVMDRFNVIAELAEQEMPEVEDAVAPVETPFIIIRKEVRERFPGIKLGFNLLKGVKIEKHHDDLEKIRDELWKGLEFEDLKSNSPRLEGFREIYRGFGVKPSKNRPSPVALISRLSNDKPLPNINVAVDIYNAVAVKHQLAIGLFNADAVTLPVELAFAKGGEKFQGLGSDKAVPIMPGELCYFDGSGIVMARDFNYLDSEITKVDEDTINLLLNVDGNAACSLEDVEACLAELEELLQKYCGGTLGERVMIDAKI